MVRRGGLCKAHEPVSLPWIRCPTPVAETSLPLAGGAECLTVEVLRSEAEPGLADALAGREPNPSTYSVGIDP